MQVTGETLERAMAVLAGHATTPASEPEAGAPDGSGADPDERAEQPDEADPADTSDTTPEATGPAPDTGRPATPGAGHPARRRNHLRGL
ncbi:hypothetical protein [Streptomyces lydicus]|uniref:Uncharacterized protein n=1 Tax=Streptomyces lydicus TaxID=47763 RepID=A0A1D7VM70_9ACTN|nr:hypothetical protein [Streptomyces lydicus]AOP47844.1 hypothetical protein SL103_17760 [Streptomyces lydicus]